MSDLAKAVEILRADIDELRASLERDQKFNAAVAVFAIETQSQLKTLRDLID